MPGIEERPVEGRVDPAVGEDREFQRGACQVEPLEPGGEPEPAVDMHAVSFRQLPLDVILCIEPEGQGLPVFSEISFFLRQGPGVFSQEVEKMIA